MSATVRVFLISSFLSLGGFLFGYQFGIMPGVLTMTSFESTIHIGPRNSLLISAMMAGAFIGALVSGPMADRLGRRRLVMLGTLIFFIGDLLEVAADEAAKIYAGRVITGISIGILSMVVPLYQSEIAPKHMRGRLVSLQQLAITLGICVAFWVNVATDVIKSTSSWRLSLGLALIPAMVLLIGALFIPQSPRYLIYKNQDEEALSVLSFIRGDGTVCHPDVLMEFVEIKQSIRFEQVYKSKRYDRLFRKGPDNNPKRLLLGIAVQTFQQLTGANILFVYAPELYIAAGVQGRSSVLLANAISGIVNVVFTFPAIILTDRWGRRSALIGGSIGCFLSMLVMTVLASMSSFIKNIGTDDEVTVNSVGHDSDSGPSSTRATIAFLAMVYLFIAAYASTWGPIGWIYPTELYSQDVRAQALGITTAANWLFNFAVTHLAPIMFKQIQWRIFVIYTIFCAIIPIVVYRYFPETMRKSLEEVDLIFGCNFNYYDVNVHHPQSALAAMSRVESLQQQNKDVFEGQVGHLIVSPVVENEES